MNDVVENIIVLAYVICRWLRYRISRLQPRHVVVPVSIAQVLVFVLCGIFADQFIATVTIWELVIVGIAIYPMTLKRQRFHWVKPRDCE